MPRTGYANLPLHGGTPPRWLYKRMVQLSKSIIDVMTANYNEQTVLKRLSDPYWFQSLTCVLGFDWHSSGTTTVSCAALKEAINQMNTRLSMAGGKGKASQLALQEIDSHGHKYNFSTKKIQSLQKASRLTAKVDNTALQDGYSLYHHSMILIQAGYWSVIQQGINTEEGYARRYHWTSENLESYITTPHQAILGNQHQQTLNMISKQSITTQQISVDLICDHPSHLRSDWAQIARPKNQMTLHKWMSPSTKQHIPPSLNMPRTINWEKMKELYDFQPKNYEELLSIKGVGPKTIRALALISELIYGHAPSWEDPVKYTFTVGGKDGVPYPVDCRTMDQTTQILNQAIRQAKIGDKQQIKAIERLKKITPPCQSH